MKIETDRLSIGYISGRERIVVQQGITGVLSSGEFTCLLGPNGAGKTTLLRTLSGLLPALSGKYTIGGRDINSMSNSELSRYISIVLTEKPMLSSMRVEQLIGLGRSPYTGFWGRLTDKDRRAVVKAMELTDTTQLADRLVDSLSDGERQRVMIAKALAQETPAIFLDEPTAFLDYPSKAEMMILLRDLAHENGIIIFQSTHDVNMALAVADKVWLADKKSGCKIGTPKELASAGLLQKYFLRDGLIFDEHKLEFRIK